MKEYKIPEGGLEVLLLALQVFEKYGFKYPSIVTEEHYKIAGDIQRELLLIGAESGKDESYGTKNT
mgnify:CR=1 FL=1|jgi:hypothetical protein|tara:strand:+ start:218 stop:415 length:198 start_codon:yes stop_codon:yes gene_type:complete